MSSEQPEFQPSNDLKKIAIQTLIQQCFLAMSNECNTILSGPPIIRKKAKELIPLSIAYVLRDTFSKTPVDYRNSLYLNLSRAVHTDRWNDTLKNLNSPAGHFLRQYEDWVNQFLESDREALKRQLSAILKRISDEFESDFGYATHPPICQLSWFEKARLGTMIASEIRYTANSALIFKYFHSVLYYSLSLLYCIAASIVVLCGMFVFPAVILLKILPLFLAQQLINSFGYMLLYVMDFYLVQHFSVFQMVLFGEKTYREALRDFIPETELANYLRTLYNPEVDLNDESDARVFAYSKAKINNARLWLDSDGNNMQSPFNRLLLNQYYLNNDSLLVMYSRNFMGVRHAKFLVSAMYKNYMQRSPVTQLAWTTHDPLNGLSNDPTEEKSTFFRYIKNSSRSHRIFNITDKVSKDFSGFEPWLDSQDNTTAVHWIDDALYGWDNGDLKKLSFGDKRLNCLPIEIVRTGDSFFMAYIQDNGTRSLQRLNMDTPTGQPPQPQYILSGNDLFFYDGIQINCTKIDCSVDSLVHPFPPGTQITALEGEALSSVESTAEHYPNRWYGLRYMQTVLTLVLRMLFFVPILIIDSIVRLLNPVTPTESQMKALDGVAAYPLSLFYKWPIDVYDYFQPPQPSMHALVQ
jgi:hypothetical protein